MLTALTLFSLPAHNVAALPLDSTDPALSLRRPLPDSFIRGNYQARVRTSDPETGITSVTVSATGAGTIPLTPMTLSPPPVDRYTATINTTSYPDGVYQFDFTTTNGELMSTSASSTNVTIDNTKPTLALDSPANSTLVHGSVTVVGDALDANMGEIRFGVFPDGPNTCNFPSALNHPATTAWQSLPSGSDQTLFTWDSSTVPNGSYKLCVRLRDKAGNRSVSRFVTLTTDNLAPVVSITTTSTTDGTPELSGGVDDPTASISVAVGGAAYPATNNGDGTWTLADDTIAPDLSPGLYDVSVSGTDAAGNIGSDTSTDELTIESPPVVSGPAPIAPLATIATVTVVDQGGPPTNFTGVTTLTDGNVLGTSDTPSEEAVADDGSVLSDVTAATEDAVSQVANTSFAWWWLVPLAGVLSLFFFWWWRKAGPEQV